MLGTEVVGPARPRIVYHAQFTGNLTPGLYSVEGTLVTMERPLSAALYRMKKETAALREKFDIKED